MEVLTDEQETVVEAVVRAVLDGTTPRHFMINAVAGSGKSRVLVDIAHRLSARKEKCRILVVQFNQELCRPGGPLH